MKVLYFDCQFFATAVDAAPDAGDEAQSGLAAIVTAVVELICLVLAGLARCCAR